ncbi:MAG: hypothetical protein QF774_09970 [Nitrospinota bacterium]|nr:hypothetical protein [Nitrospinota bacterium]
MITFAARRLFSLSALVIVSSVALFVFRAYAVTLSRSQYLSGWALLAAIVFLAGYNVRKKLSFIPLGSSAAWLQLHIYVGWFTFFLFLVHVEFRIPNGIIESLLAVLYLAVALSGALGLWISKGYPSRITRHDRVGAVEGGEIRRKFGEELIYERLPAFYLRVREEVEALVVQSGEESKSASIADFYADKLHAYFAGPRNFWLHNIESRRPLNALLNDVLVLRRYLSEKELSVLAELTELIRIKNQLDYQYALQGMLKRWLFFHIPLTWCLLILMVVHVAVVYAFSIGAS